ncbi:Peptidoglycan-associated lipoprotein [Emticicia aquatica]|uniref:Peptidoglycan-associated lipoprotein n=1 Tax=Emticicia aquatica TaxID=1681835 RepID=A0ABN8EUZ3_9BACT|nr:OmpA family protein [Emticicia aquatica]CAH0994717.1 Peptidoglycan-associated lipoprotein [Emticicia aquatica]
MFFTHKKSISSSCNIPLLIQLGAFLLIFTPIVHVFAQQKVQWANKVLAFSSERTDPIYQGPQYRAIQILGNPNKLPQKGDSKCAWSSSGADTYAEEYIKVGFENPVRIKQVCIAENFNPGAVLRVLAYDSTDREYIIHENKEDGPTEIGRMWNIIIPQTQYKVYAIKIVLAPAKIPGYNQIDALGISEIDLPYEAKINLVKDIPKEILKESLGKGVNSKFREVAPIVTPDGKTLIFAREGHELNIGKEKRQDVWVSKLQPDGIWGEAENIAGPINTDVNNAATSISADGKNIYILNIYNPDGTYRPGLSKSKKTRLGWEFPKEVKITDYYNRSDFTEFSLAPNGKVMIIACERKDSRGDKDLYVSFLKDGDIWSKPQSMGATINTAERESTPFIAADSKTIYFSTSGFPGYGDNDIFLSHRLDSTWTNWSEPENLGNLINTPKWDGYFTISASGEYAYLSSEENALGGKWEDIFRIKLFPSIKPEPVAIISGTVVNAFDKKPIAADVIMELLNDSTNISNDKIVAEFDPETGEYKMVVPLKKSYSLNASKKGFVSISETLDLTKEKRFREIKKNINLIPVKEGQTMILNNLFFNQSKFDILPASFPELNRIIELMQEYPAMEVIIEGHTDGSDDNIMLNVKLSQNRANEVKKYLVEKGGIDTKRIQTKGWGQSKPIASNATEETRKKNRRVEFTILKL